MNELENNAFKRKDFAGILSKAGELHQLLSLCAPFLKYPPPQNIAEHAIPEFAAQLLGSKTLDSIYDVEPQSNAAFSHGLSPDQIDIYKKDIRIKSKEASRALGELEKSSLYLDNQIQRAAKKKSLIANGKNQSEQKISRAENEYNLLKESFVQFESQQKQQLDALKKSLQANRDFLNSAESSNKGVILDDLVKKRSMLQVQKAGYKRAEAELKSRQALLAVRAAELERSKSDLQKKNIQINVLERFINDCKARKDGLALEIGRQSVIIGDLDEAARRLKAAGACWSAIKSMVVKLPRECRNLHDKSIESAEFARTFPGQDDFSNEQSSVLLENNLRETHRIFQEELDRSALLEDEIRRYAEEKDRFTKSCRLLREEIERETDQLKTMPVSRDQQIENYKKRILKHRAGYRKLDYKRKELDGRLNRQLDLLKINQSDYDQSRERYMAVMDQTTSAIRAQATRTSALLHRVERLREQIAHLYAGLSSLIGVPEFIHKSVLACTVRLTDAGKELQKAQEALSSASDKYSQTSRPDEPDISFISALKDQLKQDKDLQKLIDRLPQQLFSFQSAINRIYRLDKLKKAYKIRVQDLVQLGAQKRRIEAELGQRNRDIEQMEQNLDRLNETNHQLQEELEQISDEKASLADEIVRLQNEHGRLKRTHAELVSVHRERKKELNRLVEEKQDLKDYKKRDRERLRKLALERKDLRRSIKDFQNDISLLSEEKRRLEESGSENLTQIDLLNRKIQDMELEKKKQVASLNNLQAQKNSLIREQNIVQGELNRLNLKNERLELELDESAGELKQLESEKAALIDELEKNSDALAQLGLEKNRIARAYQARKKEAEALARETEVIKKQLQQQRIEISGLSHEKEKLENNLAEQKGELQRVIDGKRRLARAYSRRKDDIARLREFKNNLVKAGQAQKENIKNLELEKRELNDRLTASDRKIVDLIDGSDRLRGDLDFADALLKDLNEYVEDELTPLIKVMYKAIFQSGVFSTDLLNKNRQQQQTIDELKKSAADMGGEKEKAEAASFGLSRLLAAMAVMNVEHEKFFNQQINDVGAQLQDALDERDRLKGKIENLEGETREQSALLNIQADELHDVKNALLDIYPLIDWFMNRLEIWLDPPEQVVRQDVKLPDDSDLFILLIHLINQEKEEVEASLAILEAEKRGLEFDNDHLSKSHDAIKNRLNELLPLVSFFANSWLTSMLQQTGLQSEYNDLVLKLDELGRDHYEQNIELKSRLEKLRKAEDELNAALGDLDSAKFNLAEADSLNNRLQLLYDDASDQLQILREANSDLQGRLLAKKTENRELSEKVRSLTANGERLVAENLSQASEISRLSGSLEELDQKLSSNAGQVETAWAAMLYQYERTHDIITSLDRELGYQADLIIEQKQAIAEYGKRIKELETRQDQLSLLFWIISRYGGDNEDVYETLIRLTRDKGFKDAADIALARTRELALAGALYLSGREFRDKARTAARRGLYSFLLAGGIIFSLPQESSVATALPVEVANPPELVTLLDEPPRVATSNIEPIYNSHVKRRFDLSFLSLEEKSKGFDYLQTVISKRVNKLSQKAGIHEDDYLELIRKAYRPDQTLSLTSIEQMQVIETVFKGYYPNILSDFPVSVMKKNSMRTLARLAAEADQEECAFWDRLYKDFLLIETNKNKCLDWVINNIDTSCRINQNRLGIEYGGRLSPIVELEKLDIEGFTKVITPYFRANIKAFISMPAFSYAHKPEQVEEYARTLAHDMYVVSKVFGVPRTFMISIAHQESYFANVLGDNSLSASPFQLYKPTRPYIIKSMADLGLNLPENTEQLQKQVTLATYMAGFYMADLIDRNSSRWGKKQQKLCDLDRVALGYNGGPQYPPAVYMKKMRLIKYLDRLRQAAVQKKKKPRA